MSNSEIRGIKSSLREASLTRKGRTYITRHRLDAHLIQTWKPILLKFTNCFSSDSRAHEYKNKYLFEPLGVLVQELAKVEGHCAIVGRCPDRVWLGDRGEDHTIPQSVQLWLQLQQ